ncbi:MAG: ABC-type transport auxiliary lipoprotein family protein [Asticcacaulis sp.]
MKISAMKALKTASVIGMAIALSGCVTLLPKVKPAQLYRFGYEPELVDQTKTTAPQGQMPIGLIFGTVTFPGDSAGDQILTVEGSEVSYVAQARWAASASGLFNEAVSAGFARSSQIVSLEPRGPTAANYRLDISVRKFETNYRRNRPTVSVALDARLIRVSDRAVVGQKYLNADIEVRRNRMNEMANGYNQATTQVVSDLVKFTETALQAAEQAAPTAQ